jgi:hypothetical protein
MIRQRDHGSGLANPCERERAGVAQVHVLVVVLGKHLDDRRDRRRMPNASERFGREEARTRPRVMEQREQVAGRGTVSQIA